MLTDSSRAHSPHTPALISAAVCENRQSMRCGRPHHAAPVVEAARRTVESTRRACCWWRRSCLTRQSLPHPAALQHVAICCNTLQYVATYCTALQHAALRCSAGGAHTCPEGLARVQRVHIQRGLVDSTRNDRRHVRLRKDPREARYECAPSPGGDVAGVRPVPVQMCGSGEPKPRFKISRASLSHGALHKMGRPRWFRACPMSSCAWWPLATTCRPSGCTAHAGHLALPIRCALCASGTAAVYVANECARTLRILKLFFRW